MTIKMWSIDSQWQEPFVAKLTQRGASGHVVNAALEAIDDKCIQTGESAQSLFGDPAKYADSVILPDTAAAEQSRIRAYVLVGVGLLGMFLALWGWTGMQQDTSKLIGLSPTLIFVVGALLCVGAAVTDAALGAKADIMTTTPGTSSGPMALLLNKLAPWIIVALTLVGMLIIYLRNS